MYIQAWSLALIAMFNWQYSYDVRHSPMDASHLTVTANETLLSCIYPQDKAFKKGSKTFPRSELRSLLEPKGSTAYNFSVEIKKLPEGTDYSVWQVFGNGSPLLMVRHRQGKKQLVVFDGQPKIQVTQQFPKWCVVDCPKSSVYCEGGYKSTGSLKCRDSMYFKLGIYNQQSKPIVKRCVEYGSINYFKLM